MTEEKRTGILPHNCILEDRKKLSVSGVKDVGSFDEETIIAQTEYGELTVKGEKLHMQSLCALAHMDFNSPRVYSYEEAFAVMKQLKLPYNDFVQLFRRMVFNEYAKNYDDHTKNISFLMDKKGVW